jgi:SAM-dependent methyltransferase
VKDCRPLRTSSGDARSRRAIATIAATALFSLPVIGRAQRSPDIHFATTSHAVADAMLKLARATPRDVVYDLGSGDGRIVIMAAQKYGAQGVGIELNRTLIDVSRQVARDAEVASRVTFIEGDLFTADISAATVVTLWLSATVNRRLEPKLRRELRPGTRIVSRQFPIGNWVPDATVRFEAENLFLWVVPERQGRVDKPLSNQVVDIDAGNNVASRWVERLQISSSRHKNAPERPTEECAHGPGD